MERVLPGDTIIGTPDIVLVVAAIMAADHPELIIKDDDLVSSTRIKSRCSGYLVPGTTISGTPDIVLDAAISMAADHPKLIIKDNDLVSRTRIKTRCAGYLIPGGTIRGTPDISFVAAAAATMAADQPELTRKTTTW